MSGDPKKFTFNFTYNGPSFKFGQGAASGNGSNRFGTDKSRNSSPSFQHLGTSAASSVPTSSQSLFVFGNVGGIMSPNSLDAAERRSDIRPTPYLTGLPHTNSHLNESISPFTFGSDTGTRASISTLRTTSASSAPNSNLTTIAVPAFSFKATTSAITPKPVSTTSAFFGESTTLVPSTTPSPFNFGNPTNTTTLKPAFSMSGISPLYQQSAASTGIPPFSSELESPIPTARKTSLDYPLASTGTVTSTPLSPSAFIFNKSFSPTTTCSPSSWKGDGTKKSDTSVSTIPITFTSTPTMSAPTTTYATTASFEPSSSFTTPAVNTAPNAFSFSTILAGMGKQTSETPSEIHAALITPSAFRQNEIVEHTNFRIDSILPTTRYTELPEQAKNELGELEHYIFDESRRCNHITEHMASKRRESMQQAYSDQEMVSYKLNSLSNSLQMQVNALEELFDSLKHQILHFNYGQAVIDACKYQKSPSLYLHPYMAGDDYFINLSDQLAIRLEEYEKCVREIGFTIDSWMKNKAQSPQDVARVMTSQNQTFLTLANRVAALHEQLVMEQELYTQRRLQAMTL